MQSGEEIEAAVRDLPATFANVSIRSESPSIQAPTTNSIQYALLLPPEYSPYSLTKDGALEGFRACLVKRRDTDPGLR